MSNDVLLALGSNLGQRRENLQQAVKALGELVHIQAVSPVYETAPWGVVDQPDFLNLCVAGQTALTPKALLAACKSIEARQGRQENFRWGPRLIDIDLLFYNQLILEDDSLTLPHPRLAERAFVLAPLVDIAPDFVDPRSDQTVSQMWAAIDGRLVSRQAEPLFEEW